MSLGSLTLQAAITASSTDILRSYGKDQPSCQAVKAAGATLIRSNAVIWMTRKMLLHKSSNMSANAELILSGRARKVRPSILERNLQWLNLLWSRQDDFFRICEFLRAKVAQPQALQIMWWQMTAGSQITSSSTNAICQCGKELRSSVRCTNMADRALWILP
jgi:hypothetical protein